MERFIKYGKSPIIDTKNNEIIKGMNEIIDLVNKQDNRIDFLERIVRCWCKNVKYNFGFYNCIGNSYFYGFCNGIDKCNVWSI